MNIFEELVDARNKVSRLEEEIDDLVYKYLVDHYTLWVSFLPTEQQIGALYIGPNQSYNNSHHSYDEFCNTKWGWSWKLINLNKEVKIFYNVVKNAYLDIEEDNSVIVSFDELLKYKK